MTTALLSPEERHALAEMRDAPDLAAFASASARLRSLPSDHPLARELAIALVDMLRSGQPQREAAP